CSATSSSRRSVSRSTSGVISTAYDVGGSLCLPPSSSVAEAGTMSPTTLLSSRAPWLPLTGAALAAMAFAQLVGWLSPLLIGLLLGALATNLAPIDSRQRIEAITASGVGTLMLRWGILLLGFRLSLDHLA